MKKKYWLYLAFLFINFPGLLHSLYAEPSFRSQVDRQKLYRGETCVLKLQFEWPKKEAQYVFAIPQPILQKIRIEKQGQSQETLIKEGVEWTQKTFSFELMPLETGPAAVEAFKVQYVDSISQQHGEFFVPQTTLEVLRPANSTTFWGSAFIIVFSAFLAGLALCLRFYRRKPLLQSMESSLDFAAAPFELIQNKISRGVPLKELIYELDKKFRDFLAENYSLTRREGSEDELIEEIQAKELSLHEQKAITGFLSEIREAKFVQHLSESRLKQLTESISEFAGKKKVVLSSSF